VAEPLTASEINYFNEGIPMNMLGKILLAAVIGGALLAGCGGSGGGGDNDDNGGGGGGGNTGTVISGTASAPGGSVAQLHTQTIFEIAVRLVITPAYAEITGLQPVTGATVELIRVDNEGNQVGEVLATTTTSITGNYTLTLPEGVNLAGDLVVRITGDGIEMRAQVVEISVDITPISEFVLRKFIDNGADLDSLVVTDIVQLKGKVDAFDLTAGSDMTEMLAQLEDEVGDFVDNSVAATLATGGDAAVIAGTYRNSGLSLGLHDGDASLYGTVAVDIWQGNITLTDAGNGNVSGTSSGGNDAFMRLSGTEAAASIHESVSLDDDSDTFSIPFSSDDNGILTVTDEFQEDIDAFDGNCCGWRSFPATFRVQKVPDRGLFFLVNESASVRYLLTDTNNDSIPDAVDPAARSGDEAERSLEVLARKPTAMTPADLSGDFGRVWMGVNLTSVNRSIEVETESNIINFNGDGTLDVGAVAVHQLLSRNGYSTEAEPAESGLTMVTTADGDITSVNGENVDGFINDAYDFITVASAEANVSNGVGSGSSGKTLMIKLGAGTPSVTGNIYRAMDLGMRLSGNSIAITNSRFDSKLTMSSESVGSLSSKSSVVFKNDLGDNISVASYAATYPVTASIGSQGATTITIDNGEGNGTWEGFFNADATLGIFRLTTPTEGEPIVLGLTVLVKVN